MVVRNPLEDAIVQDMYKILGYVVAVQAVVDALPDDERKVLEDRWLEFAWQMVLAQAEPMLASNARAAGKAFEQFGEFIMNCKAGKRIEYHGPEWVAMDRKTYNDLRDRAKKPLDIIENESENL